MFIPYIAAIRDHKLDPGTMTKNDQHKRRTYRRDDGVLMVELRPGQFVNERVASMLEDEPLDSASIRHSHRGRRRAEVTGPEDAR